MRSIRFSSISFVRERRFVPLVFVMCLAGAPKTLEASPLFSNIVGNCCGGYTVGSSSGTSLAEAFTASSPFILTDATVVVFAVQGFGGDPYFSVSLYSNAGGVPGGLVSTLGTDLTAPALGGTVTASANTPLALSGGEYWLVLSPFDSGTQVSWEGGGSASVPFAFELANGPWQASAANNLQFQIDVVTPEPSSIVLAASGLAALAGVMRRRRSV